MQRCSVGMSIPKGKNVELLSVRFRPVALHEPARTRPLWVRFEKSSAGNRLPAQPGASALTM